MPGLRAEQAGEERYLEGIIQLPMEDALGGVYQPADIDFGDFMAKGYLDVNHLMFDHGIAEAVIGWPVEVRVVREGVWAKFKLASSKLAHDIWEYAQQFPGRLGFSIAGGLRKDVFERGGKWNLGSERGGSVAVARFPMNAGTWAIASGSLAAAVGSLSGTGILNTMYGLTADFGRGLVSLHTKYVEWYQYFLSVTSDPLMSATYAGWARDYFSTLASGAQVLEEIRNTIILDDNAEEEMGAALREDLISWLSAHPTDPHFTEDGKLVSLEDAVAHYRYCKKLAPEQVARALGYLRAHPELLSRAPTGWFGTPQ